MIRNTTLLCLKLKFIVLKDYFKIEDINRNDQKRPDLQQIFEILIDHIDDES